MPYPATLTPAPLTFGALLKTLRKVVGMTQRDLAAALGYSDSQISGLEKDQRLPDLDAVMQRFVPALGLQDDPTTIAHLVERAAAARGEHPPASLAFQPTKQMVVQAAPDEQAKLLPLPPTQLIGRAAEVNQLGNRLLGHGGRLLTLVGPPGIGKTRLALAIAAHLQYHYRHGAVFVPLAAISDPTLMATAIATAVGSSDTHSKPPKIRLIESLRRKTMLLVLDNCEQIRDAAPLIAELVAECAGLCILATSRERLHLRAEQRCKVPPLDLASAVELFIQRAQAVDADFASTSHNQPILEAICQRLDCLPLALELCAAQVELFSLSHLLRQLHDRRLDLLVDGAHDLPPQHRTLRAAIGRSYVLLNDEERRLLRSLGVFVGGFDLAALEAVWDARRAPKDGRLSDSTRLESLVSHLRSLIGKSLVHTETTPAGEQRFLLLETIREFALEQMCIQGEEDQLYLRHYRAYLQLFRIGDSHLRGPDAVMWFARLEREQDNLRAAFQWTLETDRYEEMAWLIVAANWFWEQRGRQYDASTWLVHLLPHRHQLATDLRLAIWIILNAAAIHIPEELQPMRRSSDEAIALLADCADNLLQSAAWSFMAGSSADFSQRSATIERAIAFARAGRESPGLGPEFCLFTDCDFMLGMELGIYAYGLAEQGELARAETLAWEGVHLFQARGNRYERASGLGLLGRLALWRGDLGQAHTLLTEAVTIAAMVNYKEMQCHCQPLLGLITLYNGDRIAARQLLTEGLRLCIEYKDQHLLANTCTYLAETALWEGKLDEAEQWLRQSLGYHAAPHQITINKVTLLWVAARLATAQQQYQRATTLFGLADQIHSQVHYTIAGPMRALADVALATVRAALDLAIFAEAFATGQQLSLDKAFSTIL